MGVDRDRLQSLMQSEQKKSRRCAGRFPERARAFGEEGWGAGVPAGGGRGFWTDFGRRFRGP